MYATVDDMRAEGVTTDEAHDARVAAALHEATEVIDRTCGWFFEPRELGFLFSGRGSPVLELPVPPIRLGHIRIGCEVCEPEAFAVVGSPVTVPPFCVPKLILRDGTFPRGVD